MQRTIDIEQIRKDYEAFIQGRKSFMLSLVDKEGQHLVVRQLSYE